MTFFRRSRAAYSEVSSGILPKFELIQAFLVFLKPARMKKIQSKMKELECSQDFPHYKSMRIFSDAQGQLTPQSLVKPGLNWNLSEILSMFWLPASMKKIRSKIKVLEC